MRVNYEFNKLKVGTLFFFDNMYYLVLGYDSKFIYDDLGIIAVGLQEKPKSINDIIDTNNVYSFYLFDETVGLYNGCLFKNIKICYDYFSRKDMLVLLLKLNLVEKEFKVVALEIKYTFVNKFYKDCYYLDVFGNISNSVIINGYQYLGHNKFKNVSTNLITVVKNRKNVQLVKYTKEELMTIFRSSFEVY